MRCCCAFFIASIFARLAASPAPSRAKISFSTCARGRPYLAAESRLSASRSCGFDLPIGGMSDMLNGADGTLLIMTEATVWKFGSFVRSSASKVGANFFCRISASVIPIRPLMTVPTLPMIASRILSVSCVMN
ncbi:hypothetical protein D3C79_677000 [compost metagenome]